jgi:protein pelota
LRILKKDLRKGVSKLRPESLDDLWELYNIIQQEDRVYARTTREVKVEDTGTRPTKGRRLPIFVGLRVERVTFHKTINRLRLTGVIFEAPQKLAIKGSYHTISIYPRKDVIIEKDEWPRYQLQRIKAACAAKSAPILVVAIDDEDCSVAILRRNKIDVKTEIRANLPGKLDLEKRDEALTKYFASALKSVLYAWNECKCPITIVGPGFVKSNFKKYIKEKQPTIAKSIAKVGSVSSGGVAGIKEALRCGILDAVAKKLRIIEETKLVEEVLSKLGSQRKDVSYGLADVETADGYGAVDVLLVSDKLLRSAEEDKRKRLEDLIRSVEKKRGRVVIVNTEHEAGKKLSGLGGIASLLRFATTV